MTVARTAGWWWPLRDLVMLTDRPHRLCRDGDGRLHADTGPALAYPVGWTFEMGEREYVPAVES